MRRVSASPSKQSILEEKNRDRQADKPCDCAHPVYGVAEPTRGENHHQGDIQQAQRMPVHEEHPDDNPKWNPHQRPDGIGSRLANVQQLSPIHPIDLPGEPQRGHTGQHRQHCGLFQSHAKRPPGRRKERWGYHSGQEADPCQCVRRGRAQAMVEP